MYVVGCIAAAGETGEEKNQIGYDKYAAVGGKGKPHATFFKSTFANLIGFKMRKVGKIVNYVNLIFFLIFFY